MARPRKDPNDPKWKQPELTLHELKKPKGCGPDCGCASKAEGNTKLDTDALMTAVLMAGYIARGGGFSHEMLMAQVRELIGLIKGEQ